MVKVLKKCGPVGGTLLNSYVTELFLFLGIMPWYFM